MVIYMKNIFVVVVLFLIIQLINSCTRDEVPTLTTSEVTNLTGTSATTGGTIIDEGSGRVIVRGVCWNAEKNPTISDNKTQNGDGLGVFSSLITDLYLSTTYYIRAYATNSAGTGYGNEISLTTNKTLFDSIVDIDGNCYKTIQIGTQVWMAENLKSTKYNDGSPIIYFNDDENARSVYAWYDNNINFKDLYGALYSEYTVHSIKLCPVGWHVPYHWEWFVLADYLGAENNAGGKMKMQDTTYWKSPNEGATNESGFGALPGGACLGKLFGGMRNIGFWWSATGWDPENAYCWYLTYSSGGINWVLNSNDSYLSVRCIKDH
jgi:uncharacterized protein (TIGR02145 family)